MFPPPGNGALVCDTATGHPVCSAFCNNGADFEFNPPLVYLCSGGKWNYWAFPSVQVQNAPWPNCSGKISRSIKDKLFFFNILIVIHTTYNTGTATYTIYNRSRGGARGEKRPWGVNNKICIAL